MESNWTTSRNASKKFQHRINYRDLALKVPKCQSHQKMPIKNKSGIHIFPIQPTFLIKKYVELKGKINEVDLSFCTSIEHFA